VSHASSVQTLASSQLTGFPAHAPPLHTSPTVHALPSLQASPFGEWTQPVNGAQESSVQGFESLHTSGVPRQAPATQTSSFVQAFESSQAGPVAGSCVQPVAGEHPSVVQGLPSSHALA